MKRLILVAIASAVAVLVSGCVVTVPKAQEKEAIAVPRGIDAKPIQFRKVVVKLKRGEDIGQSQVGLLCLPSSSIDWRGGRANVTDDEFTDAFREELSKYNYPIVGDPNALFEDPSTWKAELLVAGLINKIQISACFPMAGFGNTRDSKGSAFIRVNWQIYGQLERKVVYETTTEGSFEAREASSYGIERAMTNAFAMATQNLLADQGFHKLVTQRSGTLSQGVLQQHTPLRVTAPDVKVSGVSSARDASLTIYSGLGGHGSGFLISPDGYVLTNEHVVKEAKFVRVRLANGRELLGDVVRSDPPRDVALLKLRESNLPYAKLAINHEPPVGVDVYAIGTPRDKKLDVSVSRGIVSAYRDDRGQKFIQSDVQIHPGNSGGPLALGDGRVVGIAVMGLQVAGASQNLNFFVPISDALKSLNLQIIE
jgi:serine protease Do